MRRARVLAFTSVVAALLGLPHAIADAPAGRYADKGTSILDTKTGLTWLRAPIVPSINTLETARVTCPAGYRLPTIKEYETLIDESASVMPYVDTKWFPDIKASDVYWSETESVSSATDYSSFVFSTDGTTKLVYYNGSGTSGLKVMCVQP